MDMLALLLLEMMELAYDNGEVAAPLKLEHGMKGVALFGV